MVSKSAKGRHPKDSLPIPGEARLTAKQLACASQPQHRSQVRRLGRTLLFALLLPFSCMYFIPVCCFLLWPLWAQMTKWRGRWLARPKTLTFETVATLIVIPIVGTWVSGSVGASFYFFARQGHAAHGHAVDLLEIGLTVGFFMPLVAAWILSRHRTGVDPLPFEPDVDLKAGISRCCERRTEKPGALFPAATVYALRRAEEQLSSQHWTKPPTLIEVVLYVLSQKSSRRQLFVLGAAASAWTIVVAGAGGNWLAIAGLTVVSTVSIVIFSAINGLVEFYERLSFGLRQGVLYLKLQQQHAADEEILAIKALAANYEGLLNEVRELRLTLGHTPLREPPRFARNWRLRR